ncbi:MAG: T9SS type A sorting domain-containing protein [Bacteroidota bacterium]
MKKKLLILFVLLASFTYSQEFDHYMKKIGESSLTSYVMYTDSDGDLYYVNIDDTYYLDLMKYDVALDSVITVSNNFIDDRPNSSGNARNVGFGSIAPTVTGDTVYCMTTAGSGSGYADIFRLVCSEDTLEHVTQICGEAYWMIFNLTLSQDGKSLYYISNNASVSKKALYKVDIATKSCSNVLSLGSILPNEDLCFGGINVWDDYNNFYLPVWSYNYREDDLALLKINIDGNNYSAEKLYFTENMDVRGTPLFPGFRNHSCWSGIGASSKGNIYIAASNHYQSTDGSGEHGNVAIYKYDPLNNKMSFLNDLKSVSDSVNNWMEGESQHKVHTFLIENSDSKMYFATDDYYPSHFIRGSHIYTIDIVSDEIVDYSKTQQYIMQRDFSVIENGSEPSSTSGVFTEYYGIKGISLNKNSSGDLYAITFANPNGVAEPGNIIKYKIDKPNSVAVENNSKEKEFSVGTYPNPSNGIVNFDLSTLPQNDTYQISIYNILGKKVFKQTIIGAKYFQWDTTDNNKNELPSGVYLYAISMHKAKNYIQGKILLLK